MNFEEPPNVVTVGEDNLLHLNKQVLHDVIGNYEPPFIVLSVVGSPGSGKSFLFNYILRYLKANGEGNWIGKSETTLDGFRWDQEDEEDNERNGIRIYHEVITISEENEKKLQLILLDIDYFINLETLNTKMYAALESFCLSVSNAVIYVDSSVKHQIHFEVNAYLNEILTNLKHLDSDCAKYIVYEKQGYKTEAGSPRNSVLLSVKCLNMNPTKPFTYSYSTQPPSFKGEHKFFSSTLKGFKSLLINCFPVNELLQLLSTPDKIGQSVEAVQLKFREALSELNAIIPEVQSKNIEILNGKDSQPVEHNTTAVSESCEENPGASWKTAPEYAKEAAGSQGCLSISDFEQPNSSNMVLQESANNNAKVCVATSPSSKSTLYPDLELHSESLMKSDTVNLHLGNDISSITKLHSNPDGEIQDWLDFNFKTEFKNKIQSYLEFFVRDTTTRAKLVSIIQGHYSEILAKHFPDGNRYKIVELVEASVKEVMQYWKPVLSGIGYFVNMVDNEFDSELFLTDEQLRTLFDKARSFATRKFSDGGKKDLRSLFENCIEACVENYSAKNKFVRDEELEILTKAAKLSIDFFKEERNIAISKAHTTPLDVVKKQKQDLIQCVNLAMNTIYHSRPDYIDIVRRAVDSEFEDVIALSMKPCMISKEECAKLVDDRLTSYEEQMRIHFDENSPESILQTKHLAYMNSAISIFKDSTGLENELTRHYELLLRTTITTSFEERLRQYNAVLNSKTDSDEQTVRDVTNLNQPKIQVAPHRSKCTIGIHFGRSKMRCASFQDGFHKVPLEQTSTVLPSYIGINNRNNLVIGGDAKRLFTTNQLQAYKIRDLQIGEEYYMSNKRGVSFQIRLEDAVAICLRHLIQMSMKRFPCDIDKVVVTIPSLSDHTYRRCIIDAAGLVEIKHIHILSECSSSISRYIHKYSNTSYNSGSVIVAFQGEKCDLEAAYFEVNRESARQISVSGRYYDKPAALWPNLRIVNFLRNIFSRENPEHTEILKNALHGAKISDSNALLVVSDHEKPTVGQLVQDFKQDTSIELSEGVVEGASYFAHSLTTPCSILLQECLPYDLKFEFKGETKIAFSKFTLFPNDTNLKLPINPGDKDVSIKLFAHYSKTYFYHTETFSVHTANPDAEFDLVEFVLKLDTQGLLDISASLVHSTKKHQKQVVVNTEFSRNLNFIDLEKRKEQIDRMLRVLI